MLILHIIWEGDVPYIVLKNVDSSCLLIMYVVKGSVLLMKFTFAYTHTHTHTGWRWPYSRAKQPAQYDRTRRC